jgi:hypothetical protein
MTTIHTGTQGAKRTSWGKNNPRELMLRIRRRNPTADINEHFAAFLEELEKPRNRKYQLGIDEYFHTNAYHALVKEEREAAKTKPSPEEIEAERKRQEMECKAHDAAAEAIISGVIEASLLNIVMPNGKQMRACSGDYMSNVGGWYGRIGAAIKPDQIVGDVLSEADVKRLAAE